MTLPATRSLPKQFKFEQPKSSAVVVNFNGGRVTSDAGLSLIAEIDRKLQITSRLGFYLEKSASHRNYRPMKSCSNCIPVDNWGDFSASTLALNPLLVMRKRRFFRVW